jgi:hypothetical protein
MEEERRREEARMQQVREAGIRGKQNKSSEHFDIISLSYHPTKEGKQLQYKVRHVVNQVEHPSRRTCRDTLPPNARLLLLARLRMHARLV